MEKKLALFMMVLSLVVVVAIPYVHGTFEKPSEWLHHTSLAKEEKVTKLHFYFHDTVSGKNPTSLKVAQSSITHKSPTFFGQVNMFDNPLTLGPQPTSKLVGRAQGLFGLSSLEEFSMLMTLNFAFTYGKYNGSTLALLGRNLIMQPLREMPIVSGTGIFRLARGIATAKTIWSNTNHDVIVEYNISVIHY